MCWAEQGARALLRVRHGKGVFGPGRNLSPCSAGSGCSLTLHKACVEPFTLLPHPPTPDRSRVRAGPTPSQKKSRFSPISPSERGFQRPQQLPLNKPPSFITGTRARPQIRFARAANPNLPSQQALERHPKVCGGRAEPPRVISLTEETGAAPSCPSHLCPGWLWRRLCQRSRGSSPRNNSQTA